MTGDDVTYIDYDPRMTADDQTQETTVTDTQQAIDVLVDDEWTVEGFLTACDRFIENPPPAPEGMELVACSATPRHWPTYMPYVNGQYPADCPACQHDALSTTNARLRCERDHRRWKSWRIWGRLSSWLYALGLSTGGGTSFGLCEFCGVTRQHSAPHWRGRRVYILGKPREWWECLRRGHRYSPTDYRMCSVCCPCPSCGSTSPSHPGDCGDAR